MFTQKFYSCEGQGEQSASTKAQQLLKDEQFCYKPSVLSQPALLCPLWVVLSPLLEHLGYLFSNWLLKVHMVFGLCCDSSTTAWTFDSERRTVWKPDFPGSLWTDEIHSGVEDREKECSYTHTHTHIYIFMSKYALQIIKIVNIVIRMLFIVTNRISLWDK